jgi:hypothetical protein
MLLIALSRGWSVWNSVYSRRRLDQATTCGVCPKNFDDRVATDRKDSCFSTACYVGAIPSKENTMNFAYAMGCSKKLLQALICFAFIVTSAPSYALTAEDLIGDWLLTSFRLTYPGYGVTLTEADFSSYAGRASLTGAAGTVELGGTYQGVFYWQWGTGFYVVSGDCATFSVIGESSDTICFQLQGSDSIIATGDTFDPYGDYYQYRYVFVKTKSYYTQAQLNQAVADATANTYTQAELDAAVADAEANVKPKVIPIILAD